MKSFRVRFITALSMHKWGKMLPSTDPILVMRFLEPSQPQNDKHDVIPTISNLFDLNVSWLFRQIIYWTMIQILRFFGEKFNEW